MPNLKPTTTTFLEQELKLAPTEIIELGDYPERAILTLAALKKLGIPPEESKAFLLFAHAANITLDEYLTGSVDRPRYQLPPYTDVERATLMLDLQFLLKAVFSNVESQSNPTYHATAGAPGVLHSEFLHQEYKFQPKASELLNQTQVYESDVDINSFILANELPNNAIYLAPDDFVMTHLPSYCRHAHAGVAHEANYKQHRDISNWITAVMFGLAVVRKCNIIHDTTATSEICKTIFGALDKTGYGIRLSILFADANFRATSLKNPQHGAVVALDEALAKSMNVFLRMEDLYFVYAANAELLWVTGTLDEPIFAQFAQYTRPAPNSLTTTDVVVIEQKYLPQLTKQIRDSVNDAHKSANTAALSKLNALKLVVNHWGTSPFTPKARTKEPAAMTPLALDGDYGWKTPPPGSLTPPTGSPEKSGFPKSEYTEDVTPTRRMLMTAAFQTARNIGMATDGNPTPRAPSVFNLNDDADESHANPKIRPPR